MADTPPVIMATASPAEPAPVIASPLDETTVTASPAGQYCRELEERVLELEATLSSGAASYAVHIQELNEDLAQCHAKLTAAGGGSAGGQAQLQRQAEQGESGGAAVPASGQRQAPVTGVTEGWIVFKGCDSFPGENAPGLAHATGRGETHGSMRAKVISHDYGGYQPCVRWGNFLRAHDRNELIRGIRHNYDSVTHDCDLHVRPGADLELVRQKRAEGIIVTFENKEDDDRSNPELHKQAERTDGAAKADGSAPDVESSVWWEELDGGGRRKKTTKRKKRQKRKKRRNTKKTKNTHVRSKGKKGKGQKGKKGKGKGKKGKTKRRS